MKRKPARKNGKAGIAGIPPSDHQPSKADLEEDMSIAMPFDKAVEMLARPAKRRR